MSEELWRVQLGTGEVRAMTLDGLDRAFEEGVIDARAKVLAPDATEWTTLGAIAGLDSDDESAPPSSGALQDPTPSLSPVALSTSTPSLPPASLSALPLTDLDLDLDLGRLALDADADALAMKPKRRGLVIAAIVTAVAAAAAITLAITKLSPPAEQATLKAAAAMQAPAAAATELPPAADKGPQLTEEQKKRLLEADKARDDKAKKAAQDRAEKADKVQKRTKTKSGPVFVNGGDKFDPLNGAL
jgi:hypothetical protein